MRSLLVIMLSVLPFISLAEETYPTKKSNRIEWFLSPRLNLNITGNWKSLRPIDNLEMSYGGGIGAGFRLNLKSDLFIDTDVSICYDNISISEPNVFSGTLNANCWTLPIHISLGYPFKIDEEIDILPLASIGSYYCLSNKIDSYNDSKLADLKWNRLNLSWGIGCALGFFSKYEIDIIGYFGLSRLINKNLNPDIYDNKVRLSFKYFFYM